MVLNMNEAFEILERTPKTLEALLSGLSEGWVTSNEGEGTWNPSEVIGHLIDGEKYNWIPRLKIMLTETEEKNFPVFDRFSHLKDYACLSIEDKLDEFSSLRKENIKKLKELIVEERQFELTGVHPEYGEVEARQLIATWAVHDLTHLAQITRVLAKRYTKEVGPWKGYLGILNK
ncbi:DinB family protein [Mesobacillus boroniphilus]|uniref:DinB family protein n=1 Tax=Mesobacillus boroniphilus TaxID=308892 RepID=A0A944CIU2_9BACI|nr:DinB family protein [Mesobacillus boroniphilus]MBS8264000.1 DinB family protein [Mesobacillus boroniphilus]